jgi:P-type conjugative transfer protein TrbL
MSMLSISSRRMFQLALLLILGALSASVLAQTGDVHGHLVTSVVDRFGYGAGDNPWVVRVQAAAGELFWALALISVVWNFGSLLLRRADFGEFFFELLSFIFFTGLFYWFLTNTFSGDNLVGAVVDSFKQMAPDGVGDLRQPADNIVQIGLNIFYQVLEQSQNWKDGDLLLVGGMALLIVVALTLVVAQIALVLIMAWMLAYGGIFLLGFGGARWTSVIAISYLKHVIAVGIALFSLILLVAAGQSLLETLSSGLTGGAAIEYQQLADMLVVSLIMLVLAYKVPSLLYTLVTNSHLGLLAGTASMTGSAMATGGRAVYNTAYNTASQAVSHYRSSEAPSRHDGETSIRAQHVTVIDALRDAAGVQASAEAVYQPVDVSGGRNAPRKSEGTKDKEEGSVFGNANPQSAWSSSAPQTSPLAQQPALGAQNADGKNDVGKGSEKGQAGSQAIQTASIATAGSSAAISQDRTSEPAGQGGSAFGSAPGLSAPSSGPVMANVAGGAAITATVTGGGSGGGGFQPAALSASVSSAPSNSLQSLGLLGGSGSSGSVGGAVSKASAGLQDGPSLGTAPRQPRQGRKIDDTSGPVGRRDKQQDEALKQQEQSAKREQRKNEDKDRLENTKPVLPADGKPSAPSDDEINAFRDRQQDMPADKDAAGD